MVLVPGRGHPTEHPLDRLDVDRCYLYAVLRGDDPDDPRRGLPGMAEAHSDGACWDAQATRDGACWDGAHRPASTLEALGLAELEHSARNNRMRARRWRERTTGQAPSMLLLPERAKAIALVSPAGGADGAQCAPQGDEIADHRHQLAL